MGGSTRLEAANRCRALGRRAPQPPQPRRACAPCPRRRPCSCEGVAREEVTYPCSAAGRQSSGGGAAAHDVSRLDTSLSSTSMPPRLAIATTATHAASAFRAGSGQLSWAAAGRTRVGTADVNSYTAHGDSTCGERWAGDGAAAATTARVWVHLSGLQLGRLLFTSPKLLDGSKAKIWMQAGV